MKLTVHVERDNMKELSMDAEKVMLFCEAFTGVTCYFPFGPQPKCYRVGLKIFAEVYPHGVPGALRILLNDESVGREKLAPMVTLRCEPSHGDFFRTLFPGVVLRPYHCPAAQQPYANTVILDGSVPNDILKDMIEHAYIVILHKLPKREQAEIGSPHRR